LRTTWSTPWDGADVTLTWRYFSPTQIESLSANPNLSAGAGNTVASGGVSNTDARIASYSYFDLSASVKVAERVTMRLGCNNVLDKSPPVIGTTDLPGNGNGNTFPGVYDSLGRYFFGQLVAQF
jgi:outer membrane receptor protein involved in Fe transport